MNEQLLIRIANACELMAKKEAREVELAEKREMEREGYKAIEKATRHMRDSKWRKSEKMRRDNRRKVDEFCYRESKKIQKVENEIRRKYGMEELPELINPTTAPY